MSKLSILKVAIQILYRAAWAPLAVVGLHSLLVAWIGHHRGFDPFFHLAAGFSVAFCLDRTLPLLAPWIGSMSVVIRKTLAFTGTATAALFWEFAELVGDQVFGTTSQISVSETMADLLLGLLGAILYLSFERLWSFFRRKVKSGSPSPR